VASPRNSKSSAFAENGFRKSIESLLDEIRAVYLSDQFPWVVGYSGGKDSTAVLQLVWNAVQGLEPHQRKTPVHVISTDTLVENPIVATWVSHSLDQMNKSAKDKGLPIEAHRLTPAIENTFWVNLIGRGYPSPRHKFRWCTERLKIMPSNEFIRRTVRENGEAILVLGTRKHESAKRAANMKKYEEQRTRARLSPNASLENCLVFSPIEEWQNDDVWLFLMQDENPWGYSNKDLLTMYQGASEDGECPLVVDTTTPSCGSSRFGCWVCTLVDKDRSMAAMIQNDEEKEWMLPLMELRNKLENKDDRDLRDFRRMNGGVQIFHDRPIPGPYTQEVREKWLRELLAAQTWIRNNGPQNVRDMQLITIEELREIRRIWVVEKHEIEDRLPTVYQEATGDHFPDGRLDEQAGFGPEELELLRGACEGDPLRFELARNLLDTELRFRTKARRAGLLDALEKEIRRCFYDDAGDAVDKALREHTARQLLLIPDLSDLVIEDGTAQ
jgi:DNA sulfur modification protein DndC